MRGLQLVSVTLAVLAAAYAVGRLVAQSGRACARVTSCRPVPLSWSLVPAVHSSGQLAVNFVFFTPRTWQT